METNVSKTSLPLIIEQLKNLTELTSKTIVDNELSAINFANIQEDSINTKSLLECSEESPSLVDLFLGLNNQDSQDNQKTQECPHHSTKDSLKLDEYIKSFHKMVQLYVLDELELMASDLENKFETNTLNVNVNFKLLSFEKEILNSLRALTLPLLNDLQAQRHTLINKLTENKIKIDETIEVLQNHLNNDALSKDYAIEISSKIMRQKSDFKHTYDIAIDQLYKIDLFILYRNQFLKSLKIYKDSQGISGHKLSLSCQDLTKNFMTQSRELLHSCEIETLTNLREVKSFYSIDTELRALSLINISISNNLRHIKHDHINNNQAINTQY